MTKIGTIGTPSSTKAMLLGSGELGKEIALELQKFGIEIIAIDSYANAPAMQVAHRSYTFDMTDGEKLKEVILKENPSYIIPEIEAIATNALLELEEQGFNIVPNARATCTTMTRDAIRNLANQLNIPTSKYVFIETYQELYNEITQNFGYPTIVKSIMSSSGKGQSIVKSEKDIKTAWDNSQQQGRTKNNKIILENFIDFDFEITLLTVRHINGTSFCEPIGHIQKNGDYQISWQPQAISTKALKKAQDIALKITNELGGWGIFGVELFIKDDNVWFNEISPRPHDTGLVTLISQNLSEFSLHVRAILGLPIPSIEQPGPSASKAILVEGTSSNIIFDNLNQALEKKDTDLRIFAKPSLNGKRRMGVALARADSIPAAIEKVTNMTKQIKISLE